MNSVKPISSIDAPILLGIGEPASLRELIEHHRTGLADSATDDDRGRLHVTIGSYLGAIGADSCAEAIEELRQALGLFSEQHAPLDMAIARFHVGALLLEQANAQGLAERVRAARAVAKDASYHLERAHSGFTEFGFATSRVAAVNHLVSALSWSKRHDDAYTLLERERDELKGEHRRWVELYLAEHALSDLDPQRQVQAAEILTACFSERDGIPYGADEIVMGIVGTSLSRLPKTVLELALSWMQARDGTPITILASLRSQLYPNEPNRWMTSSNLQTLVATMDDTGQTTRKRIEAAYHLLSLLPRDEKVIRRRAAELLETWIESPEVDIARKMSIRHDLAIALRILGETEPAFLERSVRHLELALDDAVGTAEFPVIAMNLAQSLVALLEARSEISSPALVPIALRIVMITKIVPLGKRRTYRLAAAERLTRWTVLTHPACMEMAMGLVDDVLDEFPDDSDGAKLLYKNAWIQHQQGLVERDVVEKLRDKFAHIGGLREPDTELGAKGELRGIASALAGQSAIQTMNLHLLLQVVSHRPDAADIVFDEAERRLGAQVHSNERLRDLLETAIQATTLAPSGDEAVRGKRLASLFLKCEKLLGRSDIVRLARMTRCPAIDSMREVLRANGIDLDADKEIEDLSPNLIDRVNGLQSRGIERMQEGRTHLAHDENEKAAQCFESAWVMLNDARSFSKSLATGHRATIQISAGNARRLLAEAQPARSSTLLEEADALYLEAWPWTQKQPHLRAQLAKVRADGLIATKNGARWDEAMTLYNIALEGRPTGFTRWETLWAVTDAELVCPKRSRPASIIAALSRLDEACNFIGSNNPQDEERRKKNALRMLQLVQEAAQGNAISKEEGQRFASRIAKVAPEFAHDARLAANGLVGGVGGSAKSNARNADSLRSDFMLSIVKATMLLNGPSSIDAFPPEMRELMQKAVDEGKMHLGIKGNEIESLHAEADRLRQPESPENAQERAGRLVGRAMILSRLEELGADVMEVRRSASVEAEEAAYAIEDPSVRGTALSSVSGTWQHMGPGGDFERAAKLAKEAVDLIPNTWIQAQADAANGFARATRYRTDIPQHQAIAMAIPIYQHAIELYRKAGTAEAVVAVLKNLAEAVAARQDRPRAVALREGLAIEREAIPLARTSRSGHLTALLGNHAYGLTLLAQARGVPADECKKCLDEAGPLFDEAFQLCTDAALRKNIENNHLIWRTAIGGDANRGARLMDLRKRLSIFDSRTQPHEWSMAAHNLADELFERHRTIGELQEARKIFEESLALRPENGSSKYHWETAERLGELLAFLYNRRGQIDLRPFRLSPSAARNRAVEHLRSALRAARSLGQGHRLTRSARYLGLIAADVDPGEMPDLAMAGEALLALDDVLSLMPEARDAGEIEAEVAAAIAASVTLHRAKTAVVQAVTSTGATALHGSAAWEVLHWMLRAHGGQYRRLRVRMMKPNGVSPERWTRWRQAMNHQNNWDERRIAFQAVREECSSFLSGEPDLSATLDWIKSSGGSAATLLETPRGWLLGIMTPRDHGVVDAWVVLLQAELPPFSLSEFLTLTRSPITGGGSNESLAKAEKALKDAMQWLRVNVLADLRERVPTNTPALLWSPHGLAAGVPLGIVWSDLPSLWTTPCLTRPPPTITTDVRHSTLLILSEPNGLASIINGAKTMVSIAKGLHESGGRVQALFGQGIKTGSDVVGMEDVPGLLDVAPTPNEVKRRLQDHRLIVILAHGQYNDDVPEKSALALIGADGRKELLTAEVLAETPDLLRGAVVVLLSCETGAAGELSAAPAGLAGVLLAVGAVAVVAPLWIVLQDVALRVGEQLAADIAYGYELGKAVQWAQERAGKGEDPYRTGPFVLWTG